MTDKAYYNMKGLNITDVTILGYRGLKIAAVREGDKLVVEDINRTPEGTYSLLLRKEQRRKKK